jgi:indolepyruvate ferredoxin oxidoreductase, beta subunit
VSADLARAGNILLAGVGGQGTILASELLCDALLSAGYDVKKSEVHGMSQRGGRVESHVRYGKKVFSPLIPRGEVDLLLGFELVETYRSLPWLAPGARIVAAAAMILPFGSLTGESPYPRDAAARIAALGFDLTVLDCDRLAARAGEKRAANVALLGRLSTFLPVEESAWENSLRALAPPKALEKNLTAFRLGRESTSLTPMA